MEAVQKKYVELTTKLQLKAEKYNDLCKKFEELKTKNLDENAPEYLALEREFQKNLNEIKKINAEFEILKAEINKL